MPDLATRRLRNTLELFDEFARATVSDAAASDVRGLDKLFAERLRISPSYWSQLKSRERHIGEKLARQFEVLSGKPAGWLDQPRPAGAPASALPRPGAPEPSMPVGVDERFAVGLFLTAYRLNPHGVKQKLLAMLEGELAKSDADARAARVNSVAARPSFGSAREISRISRLTKIK